MEQKRFNSKDVEKALIEVMEYNLGSKISDFARDHAFSGFDAAGTLTKIMAVTGFSVEEVAKLIHLYLTRGTKFEKIMSKTNPESRESLGQLMNKYGVGTTGFGRNAAGDITLPRMAMAFPSLTCKIAMHGMTNLVHTDYNGGLPKAYMWPGGLACLTSGEDEGLIASWMKWQVGFTKKINKKAGNVGEENTAEWIKQNGINDSMLHSGFVSPVVKKKIRDLIKL